MLEYEYELRQNLFCSFTVIKKPSYSSLSTIMDDTCWMFQPRVTNSPSSAIMARARTSRHACAVTPSTTARTPVTS